MSASPRHKVVVAAIIEHEKKLLLHRRPPGGWGAGMWEFPGGKLEEGEDPRQALKRECMEELGADVDVGRVYDVLSWTYDDLGPVLLLFFNVHLNGNSLAPAEIRSLEGGEVIWASRDELHEFDWLPADMPLIERLKNE